MSYKLPTLVDRGTAKNWGGGHMPPDTAIPTALQLKVVPEQEN